MDVSLKHLPESVARLVEVVGVDAAMAIVEERGGIRLYTPVKADPEHWLADRLGMVAFQKLVDEYQGEEIEVPRCLEALRAAKDALIAADAEAGASDAELARRYGYTERGIRNVRRRMGLMKCAGQSDLFGDAV